MDKGTSTSPFTEEQHRTYFSARLQARFNGKRETSMRCPFHDDVKPSMSINIAKGLWNCHSGCGSGGILQFEQKFSNCTPKQAWRNLAELIGAHIPNTVSHGSTWDFGRKKQIIAEYEYWDAHKRNLLFKKVRYADKSFTCWRPVGESWFPNLNGIEDKPLYGLPELITADTAFITEGEKDADTLKGLHLEERYPHLRIAYVTNHDGAGKWRAHYNRYFAGKDVVIFADNDESGRNHGRHIAEGLTGIASGIRLVEFPELPEKSDVTDWLDQQGDNECDLREALFARIEKTPVWKNQPTVETVRVEDIVATSERDDMPEAVLDGRLGEICDKRLARSPRAFAWLALVTAAGIRIPRQQQAIRANLYGCLVGPVDCGKSQTLANANMVMGLNSPRLIEGKYGSAEGLIEALEGIEPHATRLYAVDELGHLLSKAAIDRASFPSILNTAYYRDYQEGGTKRSRFVLDVRLSMTGGLVEDQFGDSFGIATVGGLYDRFVFGLCPQPFEYLYRPFEGGAEQIEPVGALIDAEVWECRDAMIHDGISGRVAEQAIKFAYICACFDARPKLSARELGPALALAKYEMKVRQYLLPNPGENPDARCAFAIRKWLNANAASGEWVSRRAVDRGVSAYRYGPGVFNRCLQNLQMNDEVELNLERKILRLQIG